MSEALSRAPKVTVLMSVFNASSHLREAVESVLGQTFQNFEFLIINDGSSDDSYEILKEYAERDPRIKLINQSNMGLTRALNKGLEVARGEFIARQDADDVSEKTRLDEMLRAVGDGTFGVSLWARVDQNHNRASSTARLISLLPGWILPRLVRWGNFFVHGTYFFRRREIIELGGYREHFEFAQDYDLLLRVVDRYPVRVCRKILYHLRFHKESVSQTRSARQRVYAVLAVLFMRERLRDGRDSYTSLVGKEPADLASQLRDRFKLTSWFFDHVYAIRNSVNRRVA